MASDGRIPSIERSDVRWPSGDAVIGLIRERTSVAMLAFSGGKDSIAAWLAMRDRFDRIVPVYKYLVPNLEFVEQSLTYYESFFGVRIIRVPNPALYRMLRNGVFQPPERLGTIRACALSSFSHEDIRDDVAQDEGLSENAWIAIGTRACDSIQRRGVFNRFGPIRERNGSFFPVWDWNKDQVVDCLTRSGVLLPAEYRIFGRSFDGIDFRFLWGVKKYWPRDYERILEWFPLADAELARYEFSGGGDA